MATYNTTTTYFCDTDAEFRAAVIIIIAALTNCGWTQTADTGQINTATVLYPGANSDGGYWIGYMNDALHATTPIYMKIAFGRAVSAGSLRMGITFSLTGTNGAGTLVNGSGLTNLWASNNPNARLVSDATLYNVYASGAAGRWGMTWCPDVAASPYGTWFMVERWKNSDGTPNGNGFTFHAGAGKNDNFSATALHFPKGALFTPVMGDAGSSSYQMVTMLRCANTYDIMPMTLRSVSDPYSTLRAGKVYAFPFYPSMVGEKYPLTQFLLASIHDFPTDFTNVTLSLYGGTYTFKPMGVNMNDALGSGGATGAIGILMRYE